MRLNPDQRIEITHDILAREVYARIDATEKMRLKITQFLKDRYDHHRETEVLLSKEDLDYIAPYLDAVNPNPEQQAFVTASKRSVAAKIRRRNWIIAGIVTVLLGAATVSTLLGIRATNSEKEAIVREQQAIVAEAAAEREEKRAVEANLKTQKALKESDSLREQTQLALQQTEAQKTSRYPPCNAPKSRLNKRVPPPWPRKPDKSSRKILLSL